MVVWLGCISAGGAFTTGTMLIILNQLGLAEVVHVSPRGVLQMDGWLSSVVILAAFDVGNSAVTTLAGNMVVVPAVGLCLVALLRRCSPTSFFQRFQHSMACLLPPLSTAMGANAPVVLHSCRLTRAVCVFFCLRCVFVVVLLDLLLLGLVSYLCLCCIFAMIAHLH